MIASVGTADVLASCFGSYPSTIEDIDLGDIDLETHGSVGQGKQHTGKSEVQADINR
jgi:hypothetical protein